MRILHVFRSPVGGLFRHVRDLTRGQNDLGHEVGMLCDSSTGGATADQLLADASHLCKLSVSRKQISRLPGLGDIAGVQATMAVAREKGIDILHGHGAKGGLYARIAGRLLGIPATYSPHGGSLHYSRASASGMVFLASEMILARAGSGFCFVCDFERRAFAQKIGFAGKPSVMVHNGLWPEEFVSKPFHADATDFLFVGEIRHLKGIDILLRALATLPKASLTIVGDGAEQVKYQQLATDLNIVDRVRFVGRKSMAQAVQNGTDNGTSLAQRVISLCRLGNRRSWAAVDCFRCGRNCRSSTKWHALSRRKHRRTRKVNVHSPEPKNATTC